jgi:phospholipase/carboxylesterase
MRRKIAFRTVFLTILMAGYWSAVPAGELEDMSQELLSRSMANTRVLLESAVDAYRSGDYRLTAVLYTEYLLTELDPQPVVLYNLACCYGLMGEGEMSGRMLLLAAGAGFDGRDLIMTDTDFDSVREDPEFSELMQEALETMDDAAAAESEEVLGDREYLEFPSFQTARIHYPEEYDPAEPRDLVIALHGYAGDVTEFASRWTEFDDRDYIFACLQAPYAFQQNGRTVYSWAVFGSSPWDGQDMPPEQMEELYASSMRRSADMIIAFVDWMESRYAVDRTFLLGFSQGGIMTYLTGFGNHERFDGIATFSGILSPSLFDSSMLEAARSLPVFIGRGSEEDDRAITARDSLMSHGLDVTFYQYQGGHHIPEEGLEAFEDWMGSI